MKFDIAFFDFVYSKPYTINTPKEQGLGGTESTVVRVATALAKAGVKVASVQLGRTKKQTLQGVTYLPAVEAEQYLARNIVNLRNPRALAFLAKHHGKDKNYIEWCHDLEGRPSAHGEATPLLSELKVTLLGVSEWHKQHLIDTLRLYDNRPQYRVKFIYNPIADGLKPNNTPRKKNKFVFLSSPHKGINYAIEQFEKVVERRPGSSLYIANPGYYDTDIEEKDWLFTLGSLPHPKVIENLRDARALFYPNALKGTEETYGLVVAEALAVGTPVLIHPAGALRELTGFNRDFYVNGHIEGSCADKLDQWDQKEPQVSLPIKTRTSEVVEQWLKLIK